MTNIQLHGKVVVQSTNTIYQFGWWAGMLFYPPTIKTLQYRRASLLIILMVYQKILK